MTSKKNSKHIKAYEWRYVSLTISGKNLDPDKVTEMLGINPDNWAIRGEPLSPNNKKKCKQGFWALESGPSHWLFETKLRKILNKIVPVKHRLRKLIEENKDVQHIYLDIGVMPPENSFVAHYSFGADLLNQFTSIGIDIDISIHILADINKFVMKAKGDVIRNAKKTKGK